MKQPAVLHAFCFFDEEQEEYFYGFIDSNGNVVIQPKYEMAEDFSEGLALVAEYGWGRAYGFINTRGELVIPPLEGITVLGAFHEELCVVEVDGKCGYIDKTGAMAIAPQFDAAYDSAEIPPSRAAHFLVHRRRPSAPPRWQ